MFWSGVKRSVLTFLSSMNSIAPLPVLFNNPPVGFISRPWMTACWPPCIMIICNSLMSNFQSVTNSEGLQWSSNIYGGKKGNWHWSQNQPRSGIPNFWKNTRFTSNAYLLNTWPPTSILNRKPWARSESSWWKIVKIKKASDFYQWKYFFRPKF